MNLVEELLKDFSTEEVEKIVDNLKIPVEIHKIILKPVGNEKQARAYKQAG